MNFSLSQIQYALAVWKHGSFSKAAKASFVTQPTLSMQLSKLEEQLGVSLFDRSRQPVTPTEVGRALLTQFQSVQQEVERIEQILNQVQGVVAGVYRLGVIPTLAPAVLPDLVMGFRKRYPEVELHAREMTTPEIMAALHEDKLDGGLLAVPLDDPKLTEIPIFDEPLVIFPSKDLAMKHVKGLMKAQDLPFEHMIMMSEGHCLRTQVLDLCAMQRGAESGFSLEAGSVATLIRMVEKGPFFTVLPYLATKELSPKARERVLGFAGDLPVRQIGLVTHRAQVKAAINQAVVSEARRCAPAGDVVDRKLLRLAPL